MSKFGRSIRTFLADGSPSGLRHVEIANWSGQALACPRSRFSELKEWDECKRPGVYFLLERATSDNNTAYIGESEDVLKRLANHDREKDFWNELIIFTSKDENLTKGHVKYLESRLVQISKDAERYQLENSVSPTQSALPRADAAAMEEFIDNIRLILGTLGHRILEPISAKRALVTNNSSFILSDYDFHFKVNQVKAAGKITDDGFLLLRGSQLSLKSSDSMPGKSKDIKNQLIDSGSLVDKGEYYELVKDKLLSSSSYAASLVAGSSRSGPQSWKTQEGVMLKLIEEQLLKH
ncbi:methionine sulfoxide reductase [Pseudoalteromonas luteoviolacea]|uniref:Methionine sulfoxide reductase n=1 Tax=Pseudoalteromonas luteoviolacea TaxID=43657 RepID=A0A0C1MK14_9GAMM|nr:GIY-YIG nuclease family protein [Pseudoalteromonas luteoviolacea]KID57389.1 methionine sulfoxide reductase [Pseudoalteromonas luteoviolacea]